MNNLDKTKHFNEMGGVKFPDSFKKISVEKIDFFISLIKEELKELKDALEANDLNGIIDGLGDFDVTSNLLRLKFGFQYISDDVGNEIFKSNMSKYSSNETDAIKAVEIYSNQHVNSPFGYTFKVFTTKDKKFGVKRSDGKIMKCTTFKEPTFDLIIQKIKQNE